MFQKTVDQNISPLISDSSVSSAGRLRISCTALGVLVLGGDDPFDPVFEKIEKLQFRSVTIMNDKFEKLSPNHSNPDYIVQRTIDRKELAQNDVLVLTESNFIRYREVINRAKEAGLLIYIHGKESLSDCRFVGAGINGELELLPHLQDDRQLSPMLRKLISARRQQENIIEFRPPILPGNSSQLEGEHSLSDKKTGRLWGNIARLSVPLFALMLIVHFVISYIPVRALAADLGAWYQTLDPNFHWMVLAGFLAQIVDGALGMGYGVTSTTILLSSGVNIAAISGSVHTAEIFSSGASGYSHYRFGNVNKKLFKALLIPGVLGAIAGAILLSYLGETHADIVRPLLACYTLFLGVKILINAFRKRRRQKKFRRHGMLAGAGGFLDSFGGGGWGPLVTTTLITKGRSPRYVIGSVSLTEFFVTFASALTFFALLGVSHWQVILALIIGGLLAAPVAALLVGRLPRKTTLVLLGALVIFWSIRILVGLL